MKNNKKSRKWRLEKKSHNFPGEPCIRLQTTFASREPDAIAYEDGGREPFCRVCVVRRACVNVIQSHFITPNKHHIDVVGAQEQRVLDNDGNDDCMVPHWLLPYIATGFFNVAAFHLNLMWCLVY